MIADGMSSGGKNDVGANKAGAGNGADRPDGPDIVHAGRAGAFANPDAVPRNHGVDTEAVDAADGKPRDDKKVDAFQTPAAAELAVPLSERQLPALEAVAQGKSESAAARIAGVSKSTVNRWVNCDVNFQAALNARKLELRRLAHTRMAGLAEKALDVLSDALDNGDLKAAKIVLDSQGVLKPEPIGGTSSEVVAEQMELARHQEQVNLEARRDAIMQQDFQNVSRKSEREGVPYFLRRGLDLDRFAKKPKKTEPKPGNGTAGN